MSFISHDYNSLAVQFDLPSVISLHVKNDLFVKKVKLKLINSSEVQDLFITRNIEHFLRFPRELAEQTSPRNYVFHSAVFRLKRSWNSLPFRVRDNAKLSSFKKELYPLILRYYEC